MCSVFNQFLGFFLQEIKQEDKTDVEGEEDEENPSSLEKEVRQENFFVKKLMCISLICLLFPGL